MNGTSQQWAAEGESEGWADVSIKVRWMSFSSAGCGTEMTKQPVRGVAGDPNYRANKQGDKKRKLMLKIGYVTVSVDYTFTT